MEKINCSVAILTFNSAETLKRAMQSVSNFDEIIVCDGGSTDSTLEIAEKSGAHLLRQEARFKDPSGRIIDFSGVRNKTLSAAKQDWFFYLDSDECLTPELVSEIKKIVLANELAVYWVNRKYELEGKVVDCAATYPTKQMRFFHKKAVSGFIKPIHERIQVKSGAIVKETENFMLVPISPDPLVWRRKWKHYIEIESARRGKISFGQWFGICLENLKVSLLYAFRYLRNLIFCRGRKMPFVLEWQRHVYHWNLSARLFSNIFN